MRKTCIGKRKISLLKGKKIRKQFQKVIELVDVEFVGTFLRRGFIGMYIEVCGIRQVL